MEDTKGEWRAFQSRNKGWNVGTPSKNGGLIGIAIGVDTEANAHLIAAAPDMYEALKQAQEGTGAWRGMIDLVLAKAEGK